MAHNYSCLVGHCLSTLPGCARPLVQRRSLGRDWRYFTDVCRFASLLHSWQAFLLGRFSSCRRPDSTVPEWHLSLCRSESRSASDACEFYCAKSAGELIKHGLHAVVPFYVV